MSDKFKIMIIDDNPADIILVQEVIKREFGDRVQIIPLSKGGDAINHLEDELEASDTPNIILVDINMPKVSGFDVLSHIKEHEELSVIPVIMFSSSESPDDISKSYKLHANAFVTKPVDLPVLLTVMKSIFVFWMESAKYPE